MGVKRKRRSAKYETREGIMYIPDPLAPSGFREYCVTQAAWDRRRQEVSDRAGGRCEETRIYSPYPAGDAAHIRSTGAGGDDSLNNLQWLSRFAHSLQHAGGRKVVPRKP
jgi:hypothetical protein